MNKYFSFPEIWRNKGSSRDPGIEPAAMEVLKKDLEVDYELYDFVTKRFEGQLKKYKVQQLNRTRIA